MNDGRYEVDEALRAAVYMLREPTEQEVESILRFDDLLLDGVLATLILEYLGLESLDRQLVDLGGLFLELDDPERALLNLSEIGRQLTRENLMPVRGSKWYARFCFVRAARWHIEFIVR